MAATVAVGTALDHSGTPLGVPNPPFIGGWWPRANPWLLAAVPCFAAAVALTPRILKAPPLVLFAVTLVLRLVLAAARQGSWAWQRPFVIGRFGEGQNEYLPSLAAFRYGPRFVLDRFAELVPALPVHSAGHPPGLLLTMHYLGLDTPARLGGFCIVVGALSAPLTYVLAKSLLDESSARIAGLLMAFSPAALHYGATSADAVYLTLGIVAAIALLRRPVLGAIILAFVTMFAWSLLAIGAWAVLIRRDLKLAAYIAAAQLGFQAVLAGATGFDALGTLHATSQVYAVGIASQRPYAFWLVGSPTSFLIVLGIPITYLALKNARSPQGIAIFGVLAISALAGFTKAETERIWLFFAPFVILAAAPLVRRPTLLVAALAVQAFAYELLFDTLW